MHVWGSQVFINVGASNTNSIFWEAILLLEVQLMVFLNVWDVLLGNAFPICACRKSMRDVVILFEVGWDVMRKV